MSKVDYISSAFSVFAGLLFIFTTIMVYKGAYRNRKLVEELTLQQGKYERLLDSTVSYIYHKYGEFLPDTYWESDVYQDLYKDSYCWDRNNLKNEN